MDLFCCRYGFRTPPHLELKARPKLGEREVTLAHVTDWIEKKLDQEFQVLITLYAGSELIAFALTQRSPSSPIQTDFYPDKKCANQADPGSLANIWHVLNYY